MKLRVIVIAHETGIAAFKRHEKFWLKHGESPLVITPEGADLKTKHDVIGIHGAQRHGRESSKRLKRMFDQLAFDTWDRCVIYEYDSFTLNGKLPSSAGFYGIVFPNVESPKFMAPRYANPPWCFDRESFEAMNAVRLKYPALYEDGEADRWLSALAFLANVPIFDYEPPGFSRGVIGCEDIPALKKAIYDGTVALHGVKQEWVLKAVEQFYDEANPAPLPLPLPR